MVFGERIRLSAALSLWRFGEQPLIFIWCLWARRIWQGLGRGASTLCKPRRLDRTVLVSPSIPAYTGSVGIMRIEASALPRRERSRRCCVRAPPAPLRLWWSGIPRWALTLALTERGVSTLAEIRGPVVLRVWERRRRWRNCGRTRGRRRERGHRRRAREGWRLARVARRVCSGRGALRGGRVLLYPQRPNCGRCISFLVISQEELLFGAALLATLHSDPDVPTMADSMCSAVGTDVIDSWFAPRRTLPSRCSSLLLSGVFRSVVGQQRMTSVRKHKISSHAMRRARLIICMQQEERQCQCA